MSFNKEIFTYFVNSSDFVYSKYSEQHFKINNSSYKVNYLSQKW